MSAYIVDKNHVLFLLAAAESRAITQHSSLTWFHKSQHNRFPMGDPEAIAEVGNMLWRENIASVSHRYPNESSGTLPGPINADMVIGTNDLHVHWPHIEPVQVIKACDCFDYQSCEHPAWEESEAKAFTHSLRRAASHSLPGYNGAEWGAPKPYAGHVVRLSMLAKR